MSEAAGPATSRLALEPASSPICTELVATAAPVSIAKVEFDPITSEPLKFPVISSVPPPEIETEPVKSLLTMLFPVPVIEIVFVPVSAAIVLLPFPFILLISH